MLLVEQRSVMSRQKEGVGSGKSSPDIRVAHRMGGDENAVLGPSKSVDWGGRRSPKGSKGTPLSPPTKTSSMPSAGSVLRRHSLSESTTGEPVPVNRQQDVADAVLAHQFRLSMPSPPSQSSFRVVALVFYEVKEEGGGARSAMTPPPPPMGMGRTSQAPSSPSNYLQHHHHNLGPRGLPPPVVTTDPSAASVVSSDSFSVASGADGTGAWPPAKAPFGALGPQRTNSSASLRTVSTMASVTNGGAPNVATGHPFHPALQNAASRRRLGSSQRFSPGRSLSVRQPFGMSSGATAAAPNHSLPQNAAPPRLYMVGTNEEACHIGGSICAERSALAQLRLVPHLTRVTKIVIVSDSKVEITPGMLCREFMASNPKIPWDTRVILAGSICRCCGLEISASQCEEEGGFAAAAAEVGGFCWNATTSQSVSGSGGIPMHDFVRSEATIRELYPHPSPYVRFTASEAVRFGESYAAARARRKQQHDIALRTIQASTRRIAFGPNTNDDDDEEDDEDDYDDDDDEDDDDDDEYYDDDEDDEDDDSSDDDEDESDSGGFETFVPGDGGHPGMMRREDSKKSRNSLSDTWSAQEKFSSPRSAFAQNLKPGMQHPETAPERNVDGGEDKGYGTRFSPIPVRLKAKQLSLRSAGSFTARSAEDASFATNKTSNSTGTTPTPSAAFGWEHCNPARRRALRLLDMAVAASRFDSMYDLHPIQYGAAVLFSDGTTATAHQKKALEYGCTLDAVSQLGQIIENKCKRKRVNQFNVSNRPTCDANVPQSDGSVSSADGSLGVPPSVRPILLVQADQFGLAHPPYAQSRAFLSEHGYGDCYVLIYNNSGGASAAGVRPGGGELDVGSDDYLWDFLIIKVKDLAPKPPAFKSRSQPAGSLDNSKSVPADVER